MVADGKSTARERSESMTEITVHPTVPELHNGALSCAANRIRTATEASPACGLERVACAHVDNNHPGALDDNRAAAADESASSWLPRRAALLGKLGGARPDSRRWEMIDGATRGRPAERTYGKPRIHLSTPW